MAAILYPDDLTVAEARDRFFARNGLSAAAYEDRWVRLRVGPIPLGFPNTAGRRRSVRLHDLHHVATEYATSWVGESEISAWELAAGCKRHHAARLLDFGGLGIGLVIAPRRTWRAFRRGRRSRTLYDRRELDPALLDKTVGELRATLRLDSSEQAASWRDRLAFSAWVGALGLCAAIPAALLFFALRWF